MNLSLALFELPYSEIFALIGIVSFVVASLGSLVLLWLSPKFVKLDAYLLGRKEVMVETNWVADRVTKLEQEIALAKQPFTTMQTSVDEMKAQLEKLTTSIGEMKESVGSAIHGLDKRATALESRRPRTESGR